MKKFIFISLLLNLCLANELISPIPQSLEFDKSKALLGKKLYMDKSLSKDGTISCNSCHLVDNYGVDNKPTSPGVNQAQGVFNSPSSFNSVFNFVQFWDGRAKNLKEQAKGPLLNPIEHGLNETEVVQKVKSNKEYQKSFDEIYGEINFDNIADAIAEFEKTLITPNSPFDRYLRGDENAISEQAKRGYAAFVANGCTSCHHGVNVGGNMYQKFGIFIQYPNQDLQGLFDRTKREEDKMVFKVPSLRNVEKTAPYFHDGTMPALEQAVQFMAYYQLGKFLEDETVNDIVAFLKTLTGEYNENIQ
ncbi:cytochrome-c peroxidase [Campylobacter avium]|uniref:cytochrome-c peroxidase n=1 Tax=Campylobacter avium TaxID=522485 RepID=UPI00255BB1E4|nr:cytochrome-c peroxidase [Campylobacter avium]